jgi:hypothetical protein
VRARFKLLNRSISHCSIAELNNPGFQLLNYPITQLLNYVRFDFSNLKPDGPWRRLSRPALIAWLAFYSVFLLYALANRGGFLLIDNVNLVVHEGGHLLFGWFGETIGLWGGTLLQWLAPALLAASFWWRREPAGFAFCGFFFFENWLYTAVYMADARRRALPLVSPGGDSPEHDWERIFSSLGVLHLDTRIAALVCWGGWIGMLATVGWLAHHWKDHSNGAES